MFNLKFIFNKKFLILVIVMAVILPALLPLLRNDFFKMHDHTHVARLYEMDKALKDGHFPVRWSKDLGWGYGMPLFNFYAPLPYYFAEIFHLLGFSFLNSIKICFGATFILAFIGMFLLANKFWGKYGGFLSATAFVYSPYRSVDFYARGALGELFAISLIPLAIWAIFELVEKKTFRKIAAASLIMASLFLSHTVLTLIAIPTLLLIGIFYILLNKDKIKNTLFFVFSLLLALGLSSFFLIPAFFEKQFTKVYELTQGFSYYGHHFLYWRQFLFGTWGYGGSVDGINDGLSFHLGKLNLLLTTVTIILSLGWIIFKRKITNKHLIIFFFTFCSLLLAFLSTYHAKPIWDAIPLMAYIQFPWRLNSFIIVFIGLLTGGGSYYLGKLFKTKIIIGFLILFILLLLKVNTHYFRPENYINPQDLYYTDEYLIKKSSSGIIPDYLPIWVEKEPQKIAENDYQIIAGDPKVTLQESKTQITAISVLAQSPFKIRFNRFYFPGWNLYANGQKANINYKNDKGIINLSLPAGNYDLKLIFTASPIRKFSNVITLLSLGLLLYLICPIFNKKKNRLKENE